MRTNKNFEGRIGNLEKDMAEMKSSIGDIQTLLKQLVAGTQKAAPVAPTAKPAKTTKAGSTNLAEYKPTEWGNRKGKGYTALRKAYSYACCKAEGVDYDEATFKAASEQFKAAYYNTLLK